MSGPVPAPLPPDEDERIAALESYALLDTPPEETFDRIARVAQQVFDVPIALVSIVDRERQWFKACYGLDSRETHRDVAFCAHAILSDLVMTVPDARLDPRFAGNPLVTGPPNIRFYAGAPLETRDGYRLGTLCIIDTEPRPGLSDRQQAIMRDLAAMVVAELELRRDLGLTKQREETATSTVDGQVRFLSWLSHELRTPMTAVLGFSELLEMTDLDPAQARHVRHVLQSGRRMLGLIEDILDFTRAEAGRLEVREDPVDLVAVIDATVREVETFADEEQIRVSVEVDGPLAVRGDPKRVGQVLINLLTNGIKYNGAGGTVTVTARRVDDVIRVTVVDSGTGIAFADQQRIFDAFERLDETKQGVGLGLALTRAFVERMGGAIRVRSTPGIGSTFEVDLLPAESVGDAAPADAGPTTSSTPTSGTGSRTVLYIEDDPANQALVGKVLSRVGDIEMIAADRAADALPAALKHRPDLILLDLNLPDGSGFELLGELRGEPILADVPVVVLSGEASRSERERLLAAGADEYVTKPFEVRVFVDLLQGLLG